MPGQTTRLAALSRHNINIEIAGVFATESDPFSVRRKMRVRSLALKAGDASGTAATARHGPNILRIGEGDLRSAYRRRAQQTCLSGSLAFCRLQGKAKKHKRDEQSNITDAKLRRQNELEHQVVSLGKTCWD